MEQLFGEFLVKNSYVSPEAVLEALEAQIKARQPLGQLALQSKTIGAADVFKVLNAQKKEPEKGDRFGELVVEMGIMTQEQVHDLIKLQEEKIPLLGNLLVQKGAMGPADLVRALIAYGEKN